jgi:hypothetical protein
MVPHMKAALLLATAVVLGSIATGILVACSSSSGANGAGSDASTTPGVDGATPVSCSTYCQTILQNCTAADGSVGGTAQYNDSVDCENTCALLPMGTYGDTADTVGCRQYHATLAAQDPVMHCPHAGAGGGGVCGSRCDDYCTLVMGHCTVANGADPPYASQADCLAACNGYAYQEDASDYDPNNIGSLNCLDYHLRESFSDLPGQGIDGGHCDDLSIDGGTVRGACHP